MTAFHLLSGLLLQAMLQSLIAGLFCYLLLAAAFLFKDAGSAAGKYFLCNIAQLLIAAAFLQPFLQEALTYNNAGAAGTHEQLRLNDARRTAQSQAAEGIRSVTLASNNNFSLLTATPRQIMAQHAGLILIIYTCGLCFFLLRMAAGHYNVYRIRTKGLLPPDTMWQAQMSSALRRLRISRPVRLAFSEKVYAPCIIGRAKAIVLIPIALAAKLSTAQAEAVLLHELAHYRQYHYYINLAARSGATLQFFNPFVWLILQLGNRYREYACDAFAARHSLQVQLAESLVIIAQHQQASNPALALSLYRRNGNQLFHRVLNLLQMKPNQSSARPVVTVFFTALTAACCTYGTLGALPLIECIKSPDTLAVISRQMQREGNTNYVLLEAIRDSLIRFDARYNFIYKAGKVYIDSALLPEPYQSRYTAMVKALPANSRISMWSSQGDGIHLKEVVDTASSFRRVNVQVVNTQYRPEPAVASPAPAAGKPQGDGNTNAVLNELLADKLADTLQPVYLQYKGDGLYVNDVQLSGAVRRKYASLLQQHMGFTPVGAGQRNETRIYPAGVMKPAMRNGSSLIQFPRQADETTVLHAKPAGQMYAIRMPYQLLKAQLAADGLADTAYTVHILYTTSGIFVNDRKIEDAQYRKYAELLAGRFGYSGPKLESDLLDMTF